MSTERAHLPYLLGSLMWETGPSINFFPLSTPSSSFCDSRSKAKRFLHSNVMFAKGTPSNDVWSSASVTRKASRTSGLPRMEVRTSDVTSCRKIMSGRLDSSRIPPRSSLARATAREKASKFCVIREKQDLSASFCITEFGAYLEDTGVHSRLEDLKALSVLAAIIGGRVAIELKI